MNVHFDVMTTTRKTIVITMDPEDGDVLIDSLQRAQGLLRSRRDRIADADHLEKLARAITGGLDWSTRMADQ